LRRSVTGLKPGVNEKLELQRIFRHLNPTQEFKAVTGTLQIANIFVGTPTPICDDAEPD